MEHGKPSTTALRVAMSRAAHQHFDHPTLLNDPVASLIIGGESLARILASPEEYRTKYALGLRSFLVARARFAEDALREAIGRGVGQYVILGAGLDTSPYSIGPGDAPLRIFEVDHPATQEWKRERLEEARITVPQSVTFAAVDFERETLRERLPEAGFDIGAPSFFSWLGVTMYLPPETVLATLGDFRALAAPGSEIVFDYIISPELMTPDDLERHKLLAAKVAALGEQWRSNFNPEALAGDLRAMGLKPVENVCADALNSLYFKDRTDGLRVGGRTNIMRAAVG